MCPHPLCILRLHPADSGERHRFIIFPSRHRAGAEGDVPESAARLLREYDYVASTLTRIVGRCLFGSSPSENELVKVNVLLYNVISTRRSQTQSDRRLLHMVPIAGRSHFLPYLWA